LCLSPLLSGLLIEVIDGEDVDARGPGSPHQRESRRYFIPGPWGVCRDRSCWTVGFFLLVEVRSLPGPQVPARDRTPYPQCGFWGVETEATRLTRINDERVTGRERYTWLPEGTTLPVVPPELLKCVVFLGYTDARGADRFMGTAFWVAGPNMFQGRLRPTYLVTAAHVIDDIKKKVGETGVVGFRVNLKTGGQRWEVAPVCCWRQHTDPGADLAVFKIDLDVDLWDHFAWGQESFVTKDSAELDGGRRVEHGDEVSIAGLFSSHAGNLRNIPIVRTAHVAALRDEPVLNRDGHLMDAYLVECRSIGGLSGSPVFYNIIQAKERFLGESRILSTPVA